MSKNLEVGELAWIIWWAQCNHKYLYKRRVGVSERLKVSWWL